MIRSIVVLVMRKKKSLQIDLNPYLKVMSLRMVKVFRVKTKVESEILKSTKDEKICNRVAWKEMKKVIKKKGIRCD